MRPISYRTYSFQAMGSPCSLVLLPEDENKAEAIIAEVRRIETVFSRYRPDSIVAQINSSAGTGDGVTVDDETAGLLSYANTAYEMSSGLFDCTAGVLRRAWNFRGSELPSMEAVERLLPLIGWDKVHWCPPVLYLPIAGMELDFGGFAKEYAADAAAVKARSHGVITGLINLGGDITVIGARIDGIPWKIGISHPHHPERTVKTFQLYEGGLATSGDYERFIEYQGKRYCHILNPRTGWPSNAWASVTVVAPSCLIAGSLSTISMLLPRSESADFLVENNCPHLTVDLSGNVSERPPNTQQTKGPHR